MNKPRRCTVITAYKTKETAVTVDLETQLNMESLMKQVQIILLYSHSNRDSVSTLLPEATILSYISLHQVFELISVVQYL